MSGLLEAINHFTGNYGLTLVVFAAIIKLVLYKPTLQMYRSQKDMEVIKPKMEALKKQHADDPKKLNEEIMKMYSEAGVNPLAGCLPLLVQMPIIFGILRAISSNPDTYRSAYFLWIHPGTLQGMFPSYFASSLADADLAMVLFYGFMMLLSQKFTPSQGDPQQKAIGLYMSIFFTYMMWSMKWPCALILYWSSFQFFSVLQQVWILKTLALPGSAKVEVIKPPSPAKA
ncbi:MAG: membrane protein insertase YidC [Candidatus Eremiobacteraeota bacterium]|nr:membrane protein insertase YidC [Candidatus Eremiobacteraeota bacterium]MCW5866503.1 membrane protein insertase YidC [Candidatus Eremiobacteraeota bacterium]